MIVKNNEEGKVSGLFYFKLELLSSELD